MGSILKRKCVVSLLSKLNISSCLRLFECIFRFLDFDPLVYPDQDGAGTLIVPNAAVLIANGPNPENGKKFIEYLATAAVEQALAESEAAQMPLRPGVPVPPGVKRVEEIKAMAVDYEKLGARLEDLAAGFLRTWAASP